MAAANTLENLLEEATCPICLGPYRDPVITPCIHNFCRPCITGCFGEPGAPLACPQCRAPCCLADLKPNRQLQSMVELVGQLSVQQQRPPVGGGVCVQHEEKLKLFCQDDDKLICVICQVSSEHEGHRVRPISEAAKEYQGKLQNWLPPLQKERDAVKVSKQKEEEEYKAIRDNLQAEKLKTTAEFERLHQLLREQEQAIFKRLEEMDKKITMVEKANIAKLSNQISSLDTLIKEIGTKCEQSPEELLKDGGLTLSRCENVRFREPQWKIKKINRVAEKTLYKKKPFTFEDDIFKRPSSFKNVQPVDRSPLLLEPQDVKRYKDVFKRPSFKNVQPVDRSPILLEPQDVKRYKVLVTLDPDSAHESLALSENGRRVSYSHSRSSSLSCLETFTASPCVLGREGFCSGRHYWEVQLLQEGLGWTVGVALESVNRNIATQMAEYHPICSYWRSGSPCRGLPESPKDGFWAVHGTRGKYFALTSPCTALTLGQSPAKLGVYLDYEGGKVSLYNGDTMELLHTFSSASFNGKVHPYFNLCTKNYGFGGNSGPDLRLV